jgi:CheY-like chemotaxis protein
MATRLLLADDSVTVQRVIELTFAEEGIDVVSVGDGALAIERAEQDPPDIVLADVSMPGRDGYEVAAHVKRTPRLAHIPVVLMTGAFEPLDEARAKDAGCDGVLAKPFEPPMVIALVRQLLGGGSGTRSGAPPAGEAPAAGVARPAPVPSLDEYLEQLDEALTAAASGAPTAPGEGPSPEAAGEPASAPPGPPSLAQAFSALLAEEMGEAPLPASWGSLAAGRAPAAIDRRREPDQDTAASSPPPPAITDAFIEEVTRRVVERLADAAVRDLVSQHVLDVAERLVREEIERIKANVA